MIKHLSDHEIEAILFKLHDVLNLEEREHVKHLLQEVRENGLYEEELHKKLLKLRAEFKISEHGRHAVMEALFNHS